MNSILFASVFLAAAGLVEFRRHKIDTYPSGYQVTVADLNGNGRPDVLVLSTEANRVDWYENPGWAMHPIARTSRNIDLVARDLDGDGRPEIALASGFYYSRSDRGGEIQWLQRPPGEDGSWRIHKIATDPVVHRLRFGDLDGDGRPELVHAPIFGPGSKDARDPRPSHLWAFRPPPNLREGSWETWKIDETLTVLHGIQTSDIDGDGRDEILTASFEGIHRFDYEGTFPRGKWRKIQISRGAGKMEGKIERGSSEVAWGSLGSGRPFLASLEPWHGNQVVVYLPIPGKDSWRRQVIDESLAEGHALALYDLDGDGRDEIIAGWRGAGGGLAVYRSRDPDGGRWAKTLVDGGIPVEGIALADINLDGRMDIVAIAGRSNLLVWYENLGSRTR